MESSISQIKNRVESFFSRLNQIESRIWGPEDKEGILEYVNEDKEKN
jgi:hypothetical protein